MTVQRKRESEIEEREEIETEEIETEEIERGRKMNYIVDQGERRDH